MKKKMLLFTNPHQLFPQIWKVLWETEVSMNGLKLKTDYKGSEELFKTLINLGNSQH